MRVRVEKRILDRYERTAEGGVVIDVAARRVEDLYEDFDKTAPYHRKDLDPDLADYLGDCVREIGRADFLIRFTLERQLSDDLVRRIRGSVNSFFSIVASLSRRRSAKCSGSQLACLWLV